MAKLTKRQRNDLLEIRSALGRGIEFINRGRTAICVRSSMATTTDHYSRANGTGGHLVEVEKFVGSELCYVLNAKQALDRFLEVA